MKKIQFFSPKDKGVFERARRTKDVHPTLEDIKRMAEDTIADASQQILRQKRMIEDAKKTIAETEEKKNGSE